MSYAKSPVQITKNQKDLLRNFLSLPYEALSNSNVVNQSKNEKGEKYSKKTLVKKNDPAIKNQINSQIANANDPNINVRNLKIKNENDNDNASNEKDYQQNDKTNNADIKEIKKVTSLDTEKIKKENEKPFIYSKSQMFLPNKPVEENPLGFLEEKNEWAAINKYQLYKESQEKKKKKEGYLREIEKLNTFIDNQLKQQKDRMRLKTQEDYKYSDYLKEKLKKDYEKELELKEIKNQRKIIEKVLRENEIKQKAIKKRAVKREQKEFEAKIMTEMLSPNQNDIDKKLKKKEKEKEISKDYYQQNIQKIHDKVEARQFEKAENLQYQKDFGKEMDFREAQRQALMKSKAQEVLQKLEHASNFDKHVFIPNKYQRIISGYQKSAERVQKIQGEDQALEKMKKISEFKELKQVLEKQIIEKKSKDLMKNKTSDNQHEIWRQENEIFEELERKKQEEKLRIKKQWALDLQNQIEERERQKHKYKNNMSENESLMNKPLLEELKQYKVS